MIITINGKPTPMHHPPAGIAYEAIVKAAGYTAHPSVVWKNRKHGTGGILSPGQVLLCTPDTVINVSRTGAA